MRCKAADMYFKLRLQYLFPIPTLRPLLGITGREEATITNSMQTDSLETCSIFSLCRINKTRHLSVHFTCAAVIRETFKCRKDWILDSLSP